MKILLAVALMALAGGAYAEISGDNPPITNWMTNPATPLAREIRGNALYILGMTLPYLLLPQILLVYAIVKFRARPGRQPATFHDNVKLEVFWTVVPALTLVALAIPSYKVIKNIENPPPADLRIEIIGHQFFWEYRYPEYGVVISDEPLYVPAGKNITADVTSVDVNHAWWVPAFGVKIDAVPGRLTQLWFHIDEPGWYEGQCAELCGSLHSQMLIDVEAVSEKEFNFWLGEKMKELEIPADDEAEEAEVASAE
ncbi:cytochrome c oxidase subunit II [bacterium]|nr:cytochrome c oxidase subunit II [bacterium]